MSSSSTSSSPCAACKLRRRKCTQGCVFAPYFPPDNPAKFANVHRVFGASNVSKLLNELPHAQREDAVNSLAYEADARLRDPVYGCVSYISVLQLRIKQARDELAAVRKELAAYIGPAAYAPLAAAPPQYHHHHAKVPIAAAGIGLGVGAHSSHGHAQQQLITAGQQQQHLHHLQLAEAQQLAAAVEVAREQDLMMRQTAVYVHAVPGSSSAGPTVAVVPPDASRYEGGFLFQQQQQPPSQAQTALPLTYQMERSPPPSSLGHQSPAEVSHQQHAEGSDEGGGGVAPPA